MDKKSLKVLRRNKIYHFVTPVETLLMRPCEMWCQRAWTWVLVVGFKTEQNLIKIHFICARKHPNKWSCHLHQDTYPIYVKKQQKPHKDPGPEWQHSSRGVNLIELNCFNVDPLIPTHTMSFKTWLSSSAHCAFLILTIHSAAEHFYAYITWPLRS